MTDATDKIQGVITELKSLSGELGEASKVEHFGPLMRKIAERVDAQLRELRGVMCDLNTKTFIVYWLDGHMARIKGVDIADAFRRAGFGEAELALMDYYEEEGMQHDWIACVDKLPPDTDLVETKIHDEGDPHTYAVLRSRPIGGVVTWFAPMGAGREEKKVHFLPTHWRAIKTPPKFGNTLDLADLVPIPQDK